MKRAAHILRRCLVIILLVLPNLSSADELLPASLLVSETAPRQYQITWKTEARAGTPLPVMPVFEEGCYVSETYQETITASTRLLNWEIICPNGLQNSTITLSGLRKMPADALVRIDFIDGSQQIEHLSSARTSLIVRHIAGRSAVARAYARYGFTHILESFDHLLFILALTMLVSGARRLLVAVSAFTLGHSLTLAVVSLGWASLPQAPIEAAIALSIVFMAVELRRGTGNSTLAYQQPWLIALCFGLLHGFGFAGALLEAGLPQNNIAPALLFFNLGVEAGQLVFIALTLLLIAVTKNKVSSNNRGWVKAFTQNSVGVIAMFWTIERIARF